MGFRSVLVGVLLIAAAAAAEDGQLPSSWPRCRRRDPNIDVCLRHAIQVTIPQLAAGVPELNLPPLETLKVKESAIFPRQPGRISLEIKMSDLHAHGASTTKIISVYSDLDNGVIDMYVSMPLMIINAETEVQGSILHEPVSPQNGSVNITFYDLSGTVVVSGRTVERDSNSYFHVDGVKTSILSLSTIEIQFDPLDKSPQRSANLNYMLNNNALALWPELRDGLQNLANVVYSNMANAIFSQVPLKEIFQPDDHPAVLAAPTSLLRFGR